jgi:hypothetical protein
MSSKRTIIGLIIGIAIMTLGGASLILHTGLHTDDFQDVIEVGAPAHYTIPAPNHTPQSMIITGDTFDLKLESPSTGLQIPNMTSYKNELKLDWVHVQDGETKIEIQNTGNTELEITGVITTSYKPEIFTLDLMVIITGLVIIGFSMGFTLRKPKGF